MQVGVTSRYCRQDGGTTKYQGGFLYSSNFPATYTTTDITSTTVAAYAPYLTLTDHSAMGSAIKVNENNEVAIRPLYNSDTSFQVLRKDGSVTLNVNNFDRYVFASQMMVGAPDTNYTSFFLGNHTNGVIGARRTTNIATESIMELFSDVGGSATLKFKVQADGTVRIGNSLGALLVLDSKTNSGDPTGLNGAMYYSSYLGTFRCYEGAKWSECLGTPKPNTSRTTKFVANGSTAVWGGYGDTLVNTAPSGSGGSLSNNLVPSVYNDTAAAIGSIAGVSGDAIYSGDRLVYQTHIDQPVQASVRLWAGLTDQTIATMGGSATPAGSFAAFRYDTGAGDATWQCVTRDGVAATTTDSGIAVAADQKFEIVLDDATRAVFKINGQVVCTVTTNIPTGLQYRVSNSITALSASIKTIYVGWIYVEGDPL
jgi:hypothetical protein